MFAGRIRAPLDSGPLCMNHHLLELDLVSLKDHTSPRPQYIVHTDTYMTIHDSTRYNRQTHTSRAYSCVYATRYSKTRTRPRSRSMPALPRLKAEQRNTHNGPNVHHFPFVRFPVAPPTRARSSDPWFSLSWFSVNTPFDRFATRYRQNHELVGPFQVSRGNDVLQRWTSRLGNEL